MRKGTKQKSNLIYILFAIVLGLLMGWTAIDFMSYSIPGILINSLGLWIFIISMLAAYSQDGLRGAMHVAIYLVCVIAGYYGHFALSGKAMVFPHIIAHILMILVGALIGFIAWHSVEHEWLGALCLSVPVSLLAAECYTVLHTSVILFIADLVAIVILLVMFAPGKYKKLMVLPFVIIFTFALVYFNVLSGFFGAWI